MRQRRFRKAVLKAAFSVRDSARALIIRSPILGSSAHDGTRPQRICSSTRIPPFAGRLGVVEPPLHDRQDLGARRHVVVGARGGSGIATSSTSKRSTSSVGDDTWM